MFKTNTRQESPAVNVMLPEFTVPRLLKVRIVVGAILNLLENVE